MPPEEISLVQVVIQQLKDLKNDTETNRKENRDEHKELFEKINHLSVNGCAVGTKLCGRVKSLEEKPAKLVAIGSMIIAGIVAIGGACVWLLEKVRAL